MLIPQASFKSSKPSTSSPISCQRIVRLFHWRPDQYSKFKILNQSFKFCNYKEEFQAYCHRFL